MVGRAGCRAQALHLLHEEGDECALVLDGGLGHRVEISLVGRAAALGDHDEAVFCAFTSFDVNLCGQVAARIHLVVHVQGCVLRVAQVVLGEGVEDTAAQSLFILEACPHLLAFLAVDDGSAGVLAEG